MDRWMDKCLLLTDSRDYVTVSTVFITTCPLVIANTVSRMRTGKYLWVVLIPSF